MLDKHKQQLVEKNIRLVYFIANKLGYTDEDSLQYGLYGLCKAADTFDENRGIKFSTYAYPYISNWMRGTYSDTKFRKNMGMTISFEDLSYIKVEDSSSRDEYLELYNKASCKMKKVLDLLYKGYSQVEIANNFNVSKSTICRWISKFKEEVNNDRNQTR